MAAAIMQDRKLRIFAFDPYMSKQLRYSRTNEITVSTPHSTEVVPDGHVGTSYTTARRRYQPLGPLREAIQG
jgi:hypothetical protein